MSSSSTNFSHDGYLPRSGHNAQEAVARAAAHEVELVGVSLPRGSVSSPIVRAYRRAKTR